MSETLVIKGSPGKTALLLLACAVFVIVGVFMIVGPVDESSRRSPEYVHFMGWCSVLFFGACSVNGVLSLAKPPSVSLTQAGFQVTQSRTRPLIMWRDVDRFFIIKIRGTKILAYGLRPEAKTALEQISSSRVSGWGDGSIPANLEKGPDEMLALLENWRQRYAKAA